MRYSHEYRSALDPKLVKKAKEYWEHLSSKAGEVAYSSPEDFVALPYDKKQISYLHEALGRFRKDPLKYIFVIGIGGSNLGAEAIEKSFARDKDSADKADIVFIEDCDERFLGIIETLISILSKPEEFVIVFVSKSGSTLETSVNADVVFGLFEAHFGNIFSRTVIVTDFNSKLHKIGNEIKAVIVPTPAKIGGRYSVFSPVGLVPLYLAGYDIEKLLQGARKAISMQTHGLPTVLLSAVYAANEAWNGKAVRDTFIFAPELEYLGKWYRQLAGESLGKKAKNGGSLGFIPTVSIGSHDLHSMAQRYFGGLNNFFTTLVYVEEKGDGRYVSGEFARHLSGVKPHSVSSIKFALYSSAKEEYLKLELPFDEFVFDGLKIEEIGCFMQFKMIETAIIGHLSSINAFDQPDVENYKSRARQILS